MKQAQGQKHNPTQIMPAEGETTRKHARPYRSHRYPACTRCHKRRSRCTIEVPGQACLLCRLSASSCSAASSGHHKLVNPSPTAGTDMDGYAQVLGPVVSHDTQILESIVLDIQNDVHQPSRTSTIPIYRSEIVSRRPSPPSHWSSQDLSMQLFQQTNPYMDRLVTLYFEELHPCLPMMNERTIWDRLARRGSLHSLFLTNLIAYTSFYWNLSPTLPPTGKPDQDFAWDVAGLTMKDHSQKGDMFAIIAAALNVAGRPSKGAVSNTCQIARITALSHSIGLNHNCEEWEIPQPEKNLRTKLWWAVVVHDRWFHFAQGTPPYINTQHYNVPLPEMKMLTEGREASSKHIQAAECFIQLCRLTEIVGDILPLIYHIRSGTGRFTAEHISSTTKRMEVWLDEKPSWMSFEDFKHRPFVPGFANLQLSYLAVNMLLRRIALHDTSSHPVRSDPLLLLDCLISAEAVTAFVSSLQQHELAGFWLPYHAQHFTSAVTLLLRCALQMEESCLRNRAMTSACELVDCLKLCHQLYGWDLAETILPQTESILSRIRNAVPKTHLEQARPIASQRVQSSNELRQDGDNIPANHDVFEFPNNATLEDMFPELFAEFTDNAFFDLQEGMTID